MAQAPYGLRSSAPEGRFSTPPLHRPPKEPSVGATHCIALLEPRPRIKRARQCLAPTNSNGVARMSACGAASPDGASAIRATILGTVGAGFTAAPKSADLKSFRWGDA